MQLKHTPTPWTSSEKYVYADDGQDSAPLLATCIGFQTDGETDKANAAFIVRACNARGDMLAGLKLALAFVRSPQRVRLEQGLTPADVDNWLFGLIAKAEGR